jgi:hypothetical protein
VGRAASLGSLRSAVNGAKGGGSAMNVQIFNKPFTESFWLQTAVLVGLTAVLIAVAARYVW